MPLTGRVHDLPSQSCSDCLSRTQVVAATIPSSARSELQAAPVCMIASRSTYVAPMHARTQHDKRGTLHNVLASIDAANGGYALNQRHCCHQYHIAAAA